MMYYYFREVHIVSSLVNLVSTRIHCIIIIIYVCIVHDTITIGIFYTQGQVVGWINHNNNIVLRFHSRVYC